MPTSAEHLSSLARGHYINFTTGYNRVKLQKIDGIYVPKQLGKGKGGGAGH